MNTSRLPGFSAEASLGWSRAAYQEFALTAGDHRGEGVVPALLPPTIACHCSGSGSTRACCCCAEGIGCYCCSSGSLGCGWISKG